MPPIGRLGRCLLVVTLVVPTIVVSQISAGAATRTPRFDYTALPANFIPTQVNSADQVLGIVPNSNPTYQFWDGSTLRTLQRASAPSGDEVRARQVSLGEDGTVLGSSEFLAYSPVSGSYTAFDGAVGELWTSGHYADAPQTFELTRPSENCYAPDLFGPNAHGQFGEQSVCYRPTLTDSSGVAGHQFDLNEATTFGDDTLTGYSYRSLGGGDFATDYYVENISTYAKTLLDLVPQAQSGNGWIDGSKQVDGASRWVLRAPDGAETVLPTDYQAGGIDDLGDVMLFGTSGSAFGTSAILFNAATTPTPISSLLPSSATGTVQSVTIAANGDLAGTLYIPAAGSTPASFTGFVLKRHDETILGTVLQGTAPGTAISPAAGEPGVMVSASGTTADGAAFSETTATGADGTYGIAAPPGSYTVSFPADVCVQDGAPTCDQTAAATIDAQSDPVTVDAIALAPHLSLTVTADPKQTTLKADKSTGKITPKTITMTVQVANDGAEDVTDVTAPPNLDVSYHDPSDVSVPTVPIKAATGPTPKADLGTLHPGASKTVTYTLSATGDGSYDISALVTGADPYDHTIKGLGVGRLQVGSPLLVMKTSMGRVVKSASHPNLVAAGTNFSIHLQLQNVSYTKKIEIAPMYCDPEGNAADGHTQDYDQPIQNLPAVQNTLSSAYSLDPRDKLDLACVIRTATLPADVVAPNGASGGGTRAKVTVPDIAAWVIKDGAKGSKVSGSDIFVDGDDSFTVSIDDSDLRPEPEAGTVLGDALYFSKGAVQGLWNITGGAVSGIFANLPSMVAAGIEHVPSALIGYVRMQMELFNSIKDDPAKLALFLNPMTNQLLAAYEHAPELIGDTEKFVADVNSEVLAGYTKTWNDWYGGNRERALSDFGNEFTERAGDIALAVAPGFLARNAKVLSAFVDTKSALYAKVSEKLAQYAPKVVDALEANTVLNNALKAGYEMSDAVLRKFFGITNAQAEFLRDFAANNKLLIVIRSRATESIAWIERYGAVLKPELIKIKNVNFLDTFLGYRDSDIGRVVIKKNLPSVSEVEKTLRGKGFTPNDAQWDSVLKRRALREAELTNHEEGYLPDLKKLDNKGHATLKFNLSGNVVDPTAVTSESTTYGFRLQPSPGRPGELIPEFKVKGKWRSVTGDVDFLQLTEANGTPLSDARRVEIYKQLSKSIIGFMHGESATWAKSGGVFDFEKKYNEFERTGVVAQFAPDGTTRAVTFDKALSTFKSKSEYRISWNGGYVLPDGPAVVR